MELVQIILMQGSMRQVVAVVPKTVCKPGDVMNVTASTNFVRISMKKNVFNVDQSI